MKYEIFLKKGLASLCLASCSMAAQASLLDIDELSGYINILSLNHAASGVDTAIGTRNSLTGGQSNFALGANDFSVLSATFSNMLTPSGDRHYTGGSFGWTVFNRGHAALDDIRFYILLVAGLSKGNLNVATTGGGSAGDYFEIGSFGLDTENTIVDRLVRGTTPSNSGPRADVTTDPADKGDTMQYALGRNIGSLAINQGFQITYRFGNTGLFGKNIAENNAFYLDVDTPQFIPEPGSLAIMSFGLMALLTTRRRFRRNTAHSTAQT